MLHFNRKTEYALIAIEHMLRKGESPRVTSALLTSTREISEAYHIPQPLLAKVLQQLAGKGLIKAVHGTKGGYRLAKPPETITVADVAEIFEGPLAVTECLKEEKITCPQWDDCRIKTPLSELNMRIYHLLAETTVADLAPGNFLSERRAP